MNQQQLESVARALVAPGKGILAADESSGSCQKRFDAVGVPCTESTRREYRDLLVTTPQGRGILSGVIFYDETFWQNTTGGKPLREFAAEAGMLPGIKVDEGLVDLPGFPGEKVSRGLDTLPERLVKYRDAGARFAKWRSVIAIGSDIPTKECIDANAYVLARYARLSQDFDIVPIVEPEVLFDGTHTAERMEEVMGRVFEVLFRMMRAYRVHIPGAILKTSMVLPGRESGIAINASDVADRTVRVLHTKVPHELGGVVFLSGGQVPLDAFKNLDAIAKRGPHPWGVTFSYSRALQDPVLKYWAAHREDISGAQRVFAGQLSAAALAREGKLPPEVAMDMFVTASQN